MSEIVKNYIEVNKINLRRESKSFAIAVVNWICNDEMPSMNKFVEICQHFNFSPDYLLGFKCENTGVEQEWRLNILDVSERLKNVVGEKSLKEIAEETGIRYANAYRILSGRTIKMDDVIKICKTYKISLDWLLGI